MKTIMFQSVFAPAASNGSQGIGQRALRLGSSLLMLLTLLFAVAPSAHASAPADVWAFVDKVVVEGSDEAPEKIQIWGTFTLRANSQENKWNDPESGYLYFVLDPSEKEAAAKLVKDLKSRAGSEDAVAFGLKPKQQLKVRKAAAKPDAPDAYPIRFTSRLSQARGWDVFDKLREAATRNRAERKT